MITAGGGSSHINHHSSNEILIRILYPSRILFLINNLPPNPRILPPRSHGPPRTKSLHLLQRKQTIPSPDTPQDREDYQTDLSSKVEAG
jgi:hypothetical protein